MGVIGGEGQWRAHVREAQHVGANDHCLANHAKENASPSLPPRPRDQTTATTPRSFNKFLCSCLIPNARRTSRSAERKHHHLRVALDRSACAG